MYACMFKDDSNSKSTSRRRSSRSGHSSSGFQEFKALSLWVSPLGKFEFGIWHTLGHIGSLVHLFDPFL